MGITPNLEGLIRDNLPTSRHSCISLGVPLMSGREETYDIWAKGLGFKEISAIDASPYEGADIVHDLSTPYEPRQQYDLVIDCGTAEHCFNIGEVFRTMVKLAAHGGVIAHENPMNWANHGFWSISPSTYYEFYRANGFEVDVYLNNFTKGHALSYEKFSYSRHITADKTACICIAKKIKEVPFTFPFQGKYTNTHWKNTNRKKLR